MTEGDKNRYRPKETKPEYKFGEKRKITPEDKRAIATCFEAEHRVRRRRREEVISELAERYELSDRHIERCLAEEKETVQARLDQIKEAHYQRLAYSARALALNAGTVYSFRDQATSMVGNIVDGIKYLSAGKAHVEGSWFNGTFSISGSVLYKGMPTSDQRCPQEANDVDATCLLAHFNDEFPKIAVKDWRDVAIENVTQELVDALWHLTEIENIKYAPGCPECGAIMS